jgi:hypothetical protein
MEEINLTKEGITESAIKETFRGEYESVFGAINIDDLEVRGGQVLFGSDTYAVPFLHVGDIVNTDTGLSIRINQQQYDNIIKTLLNIKDRLFCRMLIPSHEISPQYTKYLSDSDMLTVRAALKDEFILHFVTEMSLKKESNKTLNDLLLDVCSDICSRKTNPILAIKVLISTAIHRGCVTLFECCRIFVGAKDERIYKDNNEIRLALIREFSRKAHDMKKVIEFYKKISQIDFSLI